MDPAEATQRRLLHELSDDYDVGGSGESLAGSTPQPSPEFMTPLINSSKKRHLSNENNNVERNTKQKTQSSNPQPQSDNTAQIKHTKIFINTENTGKINYYNFNKKLTSNKYHTYIHHIQRSQDSTGYIITFKNETHAQQLTNTPFNNELDNCTIRKDTQTHT